MTKNNTVEDVIDILYNRKERTYKDFVNLPENEEKSSLFITYIEKQLERFVKIVKSIDENDLIEALKGFEDFKGKLSKPRFINLIKKISHEYLKVLRLCYCPNQAQALQSLEKLLGMDNRRFMPYLKEQLFNYCGAFFDQYEILYRVRDGKIDESIDNCWHTPFNIRQHSYAGRFSSPGFPCLYLADSPETCNAEVGELKKGYARWLGEFRLKEKQRLVYLDLTIPSADQIASSTPYEKIKYILSYPLRLLCTTYALHKSDQFGEEYLFSQVLINLLSHPLSDKSGINSVIGVVYNSTKNPEGISFALPAKSDSIPPGCNEIYSRKLQEIFQHDRPMKIKENKKRTSKDTVS